MCKQKLIDKIIKAGIFVFRCKVLSYTFFVAIAFTFIFEKVLHGKLSFKFHELTVVWIDHSTKTQ